MSERMTYGELAAADDAGEPRHPWRRLLDWPLMLFLAWLLFELTADAAVGAVVACAKFGSNDLLTARWLRRRDPLRARGKVCFWFYLAAGLWKVSVTAAVVMVVFMFVVLAAEVVNPRGQNDPAMLTATCIQAALGFVLAAGATLIGAARALRGHLKIWVDGAVHSARRSDCWPPVNGCRINRAGGLITTALITAIALFFIGFFIIQFAVFGQPGAVKPGAAPWLAGVMMAAMVLSGLLFLGGREWLNHRIVAVAPWECWHWSEAESASDATPT